MYCGEKRATTHKGEDEHLRGKPRLAQLSRRPSQLLDQERKRTEPGCHVAWPLSPLRQHIAPAAMAVRPAGGQLQVESGAEGQRQRSRTAPATCSDQQPSLSLSVYNMALICLTGEMTKGDLSSGVGTPNGPHLADWQRPLSAAAPAVCGGSARRAIGGQEPFELLDGSQSVIGALVAAERESRWHTASDTSTAGDPARLRASSSPAADSSQSLLAPC